MNFAAPRPRPSVDLRLRSRLSGAAVGVLAAVALGAAAVPPEAPSVASEAGALRELRPVPLGRAAPTADVVAIPARTPSATIPRPTPSTTIAPSTPIATMPRSGPTRLHIPAIDVDTDLVGLGLQDDGRLEVPPGPFPAGWYRGAPTPGELGPAILAGHVDHGGVAGVFFRLRELQPGNTVEVTREDGTTAVFRVTRVEQHAKDAFPTAAVYGDIDHAGLRLITCGGGFDPDARSYLDNIVVFAELDPDRTARRAD